MMMNTSNEPILGLLKQTMDALPELICTLDSEKRVRWMNAAMEKRLGITPGEAEGLTFYEALHGKACPTEFCPLCQLLKDNQEHSAEVYVDRLGGDFLVTCTPLRDTEGQLIGSVHVARDITERKQAEEALRQSERRFSQLIQNSFDTIVIIDADGVQRYVSDSAERVHGYTPVELIDISVIEHMIHPDDQERVRMAFREIVETGSGGTHYRHRCKVGGWVHLEARGTNQLNNPDICGIVINVREITDRKRAEEKLEKEHAFLQSVINSIPGIFYLFPLTEDSKMFRWNDALGNITGYTDKEIGQMNPMQFMEPRFYDIISEKMKEVLEKESATVEATFVRKDGYCVPMLLTGKLLTIDGIPYDVGVGIDITDRKQAEESLRESQATFRKLFDESADAILLIDKNRVFVECNQAALTLLKMNREEFLHRPPVMISPEFQPNGRRSDEAAQDMMDQAYAKGRHRFDWTCVNSEGGEFIVEVSLMPIIINGQTMLHTTWRDITDRKRQEDEKEKLQNQLAQAQKMESVGRLAGGVAHDFNNMLGVILGNVELALGQIGADESMYAHLEEIQKAAERSADLTRQLLAYARKQAVTPKVLDLNEVVERMLKMLRRLIGEDIELSWLPGRNLGLIIIDPSQVDQILANLCVNARDAIAGTGKLTIATDNVSLDEAFCIDHAAFVPGEYVLLTVSDDGCGMDPETQANIFEPFFSTKEMGKGTGLGLATIYGAVKQNNGFISVNSELGKGTTFRIYLPQHTAKAASRPEQQHAQAPVVGGETILLVEDEPAILKMTTIMLEMMGYVVIAATTPGEAIRLARERQGRIDLLMTDVIMPEMNGRDLARNIMSIYPDIRRLFMSGYTADVIAHHGVLDEGVHFIQKPFVTKNLAAKLKEAIDKE